MSRQVALWVVCFLLVHQGAHAGARYAIDSGGGTVSSGSLAGRASIGSPIETTRAVHLATTSFPGLIEVLYPPLPPPDPDLDSDGNGLPDQWELDKFGSIGVSPAADADWDGTTNEMEYLAGTIPTDPSSVFRPAAYRQGDYLVVPVPTIPGRSYSLWGSRDLQAWDLLDAAGGDGTTIEFSYLLNDSGALPYFLRIEIALPQP